jgi:hypothetical protein
LWTSATGISSLSPTVKRVGSSTSTKKGCQTLRGARPTPRRPSQVEAVASSLHVVMLSGSSSGTWARPCASERTSGAHTKVSGKNFRTRGGAALAATASFPVEGALTASSTAIPPSSSLASAWNIGAGAACLAIVGMAISS